MLLQKQNYKSKLPNLNIHIQDCVQCGTTLGQVTGGAPVGIGTRGPGEQQIEIDRRLVQTTTKTTYALKS